MGPRVVLVFVLVVTALARAAAPAHAAAPANTTPPAIGGIARDGQQLTSDTGTWTGTGTLTYARRWQRCDTAGLECVNLSATGATYKVVPADVGATLRVTVTATNAEGVTTASSAATAIVTGIAPQNTAAPTITGNPRSGQLLTAAKGTWTGTPTLTYEYEWRRCDATGSNCAPIADPSGAGSYRATDADLGATIRVRVIATGPGGSADATAAQTAVIGPAAPPVLVTAPTVSGSAMDGQVLSSTTGTWTGAATIAFSRRWQRCDALGVACLDITGATGTSYTATAADIAGTLRVVVTATNPDGTATAASDVTAVVAPAPPTLTTAPAISGATRVGQTLTVSTGSWKGTAPLVPSYQWDRCDATGANCEPIDGATGAAYVASAADLGATLRAAVTMTNVAGSATAAKTTAAIGPAQPPVSTAPPAITGTARDGQALTGTTGSWTGVSPITYTRRWQRCDATGANCTDIAATAASYTLTSADVGATMRIAVTAANADGTATATSAPTAVVAPDPPRNTALPTISGTAKDGALLTAAKGTWAGTTPLTYAYQWQRCALACAPIAGATADTYRLVSADIGSTIKLQVTATNQAGSATATSAATAAIAAAAPVIAVAPRIVGTARDGVTLDSDTGTWTGTAPIGYTRRWQRCSSTGSACADITGATAATFTPDASYVGATLRLRVDAVNGAGSATAFSAVTAVVATAPPVAVAAPAVTGVAADGELLSGSSGDWGGTAPLTLARQWERCDELLACQPIPGATQAGYRLTSADVGATVRERVTASNAAGSATQVSEPVGPVVPVAPAAGGAPAITGTVRDGSVLTAGGPVWTGTTPMTIAYQWRRCAADGTACADIAGATATSYTLTPDDVGSTIRVAVTAANVAGETRAESLQTTLVAARPPVTMTAPAISGVARDALTLTADDGAWSGTEPLAFTHAWQRCKSDGTACQPIAGASSRTYTVRTEDVGATLRVAVSATNAAGTTTATSPATGVVQPHPPVNLTPPVVTGEVRDGALLGVDPGEWTGVVLISLEYQWWRCDAAGENCGRIAGATASTYRLTPVEIGLTLRAEVIGRNAGGVTSAMTAASAIGVPSPPESTGAPVVGGHHGVGALLTATPGTWTGSPTIAYEYAWLRCDGAGENCTEVAAGDSYEPAAADVGSRMRVRVRATNAAGAAEAVSAPSPAIRDDPPVNTAAPAIAGEPVAAGVRLTAQPGDWGGYTPMSTAYQWQRCDGFGEACAPVAEATGATYIPAAADLGFTLRVAVTRDNGVGAATAVSAATPAVLAEPPRNVQAPAVTAAGLRPDSALTGTTGSWTGAEPITFASQWLRCDAGGENCALIPDATGAKYTLTEADIGHTVRLRVEARNATTAVTARSEPSGLVLAVAPSTTGTPKLTSDGKPATGGVVHVEAGTWKGTAPLRFSYQWQRCAAVPDCEDIPGATGAELQLSDADVGLRVRVMVRVANDGGEKEVASAASEPVLGRPPVSRTPPTIGVTGGGAPRDGRKLVAGDGDWDGTLPLAFAYEWRRCEAKGCKPIKGADGAEYTLTAEDVDKSIAVAVTAKNAAGKATAVSASTKSVAPAPPAVEKRPAITAPPGTLTAGTKLETTPARFGGTGPLTLKSRWLRCNARGARCKAIQGAEADTYDVKPADLRKRALKGTLVYAVTARNGAGAVTAKSSPFPPKRLARVKIAATTLRLSRRGTAVVVPLSCRAARPDRCRGTITIGRWARGTANLPAGATTRVNIPLLPGARDTIARAGSLRVIVRFRPSNRVTGRTATRKARLVAGR